MVAQMSGRVSFKIITTDRDMGDDSPYQDIATERWIHRESYKIKYLAPGSLTVNRCVQILSSEDYDFVYLNSVYDPTFTFRPIIARNLLNAKSGELVIAPRGELSPGSVGLKSWKKRPYLKFSTIFPSRS